MTDRNRFVTFRVPRPRTRARTIELDLTLDSPPAGRTFRRRRLGVLTGLLVATLSVGSLVAEGEDGGVSMVAAGASSEADDGGVVVGTSEGSVTLADVFAETTSTLLAATSTTLAEPTTTEAPSSTTSSTETTGPPPTSTSAAPATTAAPSSTTAAPTTAAPTTAPPTTAAPTTAPPSTAARRSSPSTTAASRSSGDSEYSDPNSTQVWLDLAQCESGGNWSIDTGNGYYGGLQFSLGSWESVGGSGYPHEHPRDTQIDMGRRLQARDGWGAWPHCSEKLGLR